MKTRLSHVTARNERIAPGGERLNLLNLAGKWRDVLSTHFELQGGKSGRLASMEGLRGLAILLVFLCHYYDIVWRDLPSQSEAFSQMGRILIGGRGLRRRPFFCVEWLSDLRRRAPSKH